MIIIMMIIICYYYYNNYNIIFILNIFKLYMVILGDIFNDKYMVRLYIEFVVIFK